MARRLAVVVPAVLAPAVVLAVDPWGWYPFGPLRWLITSALVLVGVAALLACPARECRAGLPRDVGWAAGLLVVAMAAAAVFAVDDLYAWTGTPERRAGVVLWGLCALALVLGASSAENRSFVPGLVIAGAVLGVSATAEALGWEPDLLDAGSRLTGLMGSSAYLGAAAALLLPVALAVSVASSGPPVPSAPVRLLGGCAAIGLLVALVGSGARAAWVGLVVATLVVVAIRRRPILDRARLLSPVLLAVAALVGVLSIGIVVLATPAGDRAVALFDSDAPGGAGRLDEWRVAARVMARHPVTGVGPEGYRIAFAEGVDARYQTRHGREPLPDRAHSGPLDVALAGGPVALAAWLAVWALVGRGALRILRSGSLIEVGVAAGLIAHWVGQLLLFPLAELEPIAWLMAGWLVVRGEPTAARSAARSLGRSVHPVAASWLRRAGAIFGGVLAAAAVVVGVIGVAADRQAQVAASTVFQNDPERSAAALRAAESAVDLRPDIVRHHLLLAQVRVAAGEGLHSALDAVDGALDVSPRDPVARLVRARYLVDRAIATEVPAHAAVAREEVWSLLADDPLDTRVWALAAVLAAVDG